jgi:radical SAM protein with 4Fe4S-binding SPASM domain
MTATTSAERRRVPAVLFEVTERCNLDCLYCYNVHKRPGGGTKAVGSYERARAVLERLFEIADVGRVTFSGGEPFLAERFVDHVRFCRERGKGVLVTSNGNGGTDAAYEALVALGVETFVFPFHSADPAVHDAMSSVPGSHAHSLASLERVRDLGAKAIPIAVLTRKNAGLIAETLLALKARGFRRIIVNRVNAGGRAITEAERIALGVAELRAAYAAVNDIAEKCGLWISSNVCTPHCVLDPADYPRVGFGACDVDLENRPITIDTAGDIRFCNHSPVVMGNLFRDDLGAVLSSEYALRWRDTVPDECAGCGRFSECMGGCRAASEQLGFDMRRVDPIAWGRVGVL